MTAPPAPRSNLRQLVRNVSTQWLGILIQAAVAFAVTPYQIRRLGVDGNGVIAVINSYVGYSGLLSLGLGSAVVKYIAFAAALTFDADERAGLLGPILRRLGRA